MTRYCKPNDLALTVLINARTLTSVPLQDQDGQDVCCQGVSKEQRADFSVIMFYVHSPYFTAHYSVCIREKQPGVWNLTNSTFLTTTSLFSFDISYLVQLRKQIKFDTFNIFFTLKGKINRLLLSQQDCDGGFTSVSPTCCLLPTTHRFLNQRGQKPVFFCSHTVPLISGPFLPDITLHPWLWLSSFSSVSCPHLPSFELLL